jgi:hypothetical protein
MFDVVGKCNKVNLVFPEEKDPSLQKSSARRSERQCLPAWLPKIHYLFFKNTGFTPLIISWAIGK